MLTSACRFGPEEHITASLAAVSVLPTCKYQILFNQETTNQRPRLRDAHQGRLPAPGWLHGKEIFAILSSSTHGSHNPKCKKSIMIARGRQNTLHSGKRLTFKVHFYPRDLEVSSLSPWDYWDVAGSRTQTPESPHRRLGITFVIYDFCYIS